MTHNINEENIRVAAYYIWEQAGRPEGKDKECWIKACEQLFAVKPAKKSVKKVTAKKVAPVKTVAKAVAKPAVRVAPKVSKPAKKAEAKPVVTPKKK